ncbi:hypothetical protein C8J56DRAFT_1030485 [Mycena floridula]|nr:hypothetical protein C8J56DRAFT_1030485 [Mycena floridula]
MAPIPNPRIIFAKTPKGRLPVPGKDLVYDATPIIDIENVPLNGGWLTKNLILSPEPYMRARLRDPTVQSYSTPMNLGAPSLLICDPDIYSVTSMALVVVVRSEREGINVGDYILLGYFSIDVSSGRFNHDPAKSVPETFDMDSLVLQHVPDPKGTFPLSNYCSVLGIPGLTGYTGFVDHAEAKEGETIFVSAGASGAGSIVIQLAKAKGMKVIGSAGSDTKVEYMRSIGCDYPFNYKTKSYNITKSDRSGTKSGSFLESETSSGSLLESNTSSGSSTAGLCPGLGMSWRTFHVLVAVFQFIPRFWGPIPGEEPDIV